MTTTHRHPHPRPARHHDVLIVGGGAAGLSGALTLARARRSVLVVDAGRPRNAPAEGIHGLLGREGLPPAELTALGRAEVASYGGEFHDAEVLSVAREEDGGFRAELSDGTAVHARRLLLTTGTTDLLPELPGLAERWGRQVVHCPYCHGWEVRDRKIAVLATNPAVAIHQALLWRQWSGDVTLLAHTAAPSGEQPSDEQPSDEQSSDERPSDEQPFDERQRRELAARGVRVVPGEVVALLPEDGAAELTGVRLADGTVVDCAVLAVGTELTVTAPFLAELGLAVTDLDFGGVRFATRLATTDPTGATGVPGVWAAGNLTDPVAQVAIAAADGLRAGAAINADLVAEETRLAVDAVEFWEKRYGESGQIWSGRPNASLTVQATGLAPGRALDLGCGEGGDAIWLAERGWQVTAVDISRVALERAAARAAVAGVADRIDWQRVDLAHAFPSGAYDLVSAQFLHSPAEFPRDRVLRRAAAAVAPGGTLLITSHAAPPARHDDPHPDLHLPTPEEMLAALQPAPGEWTVELAEEHARHDHPGHPVTDPDARPHRDSTLRLRRKG
ncbi:FAD-dependent oxidoreductase [Kitasatospora sp. NPDC090308]|uniref:FAD-dependent oxidoreductase n=1 Tax=Kitasatospora sp. NPDC090308 TaxID=3364082 RepID=UPI00382D19C1